MLCSTQSIWDVREKARVNLANGLAAKWQGKTRFFLSLLILSQFLVMCSCVNPMHSKIDICLAVQSWCCELMKVSVRVTIESMNWIPLHWRVGREAMCRSTRQWTQVETSTAGGQRLIRLGDALKVNWKFYVWENQTKEIRWPGYGGKAKAQPGTTIPCSLRTWALWNVSLHRVYLICLVTLIACSQRCSSTEYLSVIGGLCILCHLWKHNVLWEFFQFILLVSLALILFIFVFINLFFSYVFEVLGLVPSPCMLESILPLSYISSTSCIL